MSNQTEAIKRPSLSLFLTEGFRALVVERARYERFMRSYPFAAHQGDGHPVLVLPGLMASDVSTRPLRRFIRKLGYTPYRWGLGTNTAKMEDYQKMLAKLEKIYLKHEQKVSLIGWSLGGIFARQMAKEKPQLVRQLIMLGTPFAGPEQPNNAKWFYELLTTLRKDAPLDEEWVKDIPRPAPVPTTAIYSRSDGIVPWEVCREAVEDELHQNVEVESSHFGMGLNPQVLRIIADRLQYDASYWVPYAG
ncbi:MAG: alpha/beta hydrolase [Bacteroidetes bacterium]|nr:MAG: alpha/beta hydrolase [Bacteroidota bacterium]